ncbi:hypothetical protein F4811DRAFT_524415 [Daldinia bambusicola]|nr:hypothetical protein F4811DRAFT_524415 [Daldinia bambusicola]
MPSAALSPQQLDALVDILVHHETYSEAESFKYPESIEKYGYPFCLQTSNGSKDGGSNGVVKSSSPLLQLLLTRLILPVPGVRDLPPEFWSTKFRSIMRRFGEAELSESYDKGTLGSRKRLASAASVIHECITRGLLNGIPNDNLPNLQSQYDTRKAEDLSKAWDDVVQHLVYGNLIDELFDHFTKTANLEDHSPVVDAAVNLAIIYIATFLHHLFVLSAEGPYLLKLINNIHGLIPYSVIGQTLRVGNAGTMINAMVRLFLAKVSVGAISNWLGLTQNASDGMNLLQRIISLVLEWDTGEFRKATDNIRRSKNGPNESCLAAIDEHLQASRDQHESFRELSKRDGKSIIVAILEAKDESLLKSLTEEQHAQYLQYYSAQLAIRDREKITEVLCRQTPDLTTTLVRDVVSVFEPMIRDIHKNVDIRKHLSSVESFLTDLIETSKPKVQENGKPQGSTTPPSVEDYVTLLKRNRHLAYEYLRDFADGCPDLRETWLDWAKQSLETFRRTPKGKGIDEPGEIDRNLQDLFSRLPLDQQTSVRESIDNHVRYLSTSEKVSTMRMQSIIDGLAAYEKKEMCGSMGGPGVYITRWHCLLDETIVTPNTPKGPPRRGKDVKGLKALGKTEAIAKTEAWDPDALTRQEEQAWPEPPDVSIVVNTLGPQFRTLIADIASAGLPCKQKR